jgi:hypothetical protein
MTNYVNAFKNIVIILLIGLSANLFLRVRKSNNSKIKELQRMRKQSEEVVKKKEHEIQNLRKAIQQESFLVGQALEEINQIRFKKQEIETLYVHKVRQINSYDSNELKNYFDEELN